MVFAPSIRYPRLLEISHKNGICSLFTGKYNFRVVLGWGICTLFLTPTVGFLYERRTPSGAFAPFPKQNDKFLTNALGGRGLGTFGIDWAIKEYRFFIVYLILFRRFVEPATVRSPCFSVRSTLVDHPLFLKMNFHQPPKRKWAIVSFYIIRILLSIFVHIVGVTVQKYP